MQNVGPGLADELVVARPARERIVAIAALEGVGTVLAVESIVARPTDEEVGA